MQNQSREKVKSLQDVYRELVEADVIVKSRLATCKSSLRKYAEWLGSAFESCSQERFIKSKEERDILVEKSLNQMYLENPDHKELSSSAIRNIKNDVSFVLRKAKKLGIIKTNIEINNWSEARKTLVKSPTYLPARQESDIAEKYILDPVPKMLVEDLAEYEAWCVSEFMPNRPRTLKRRPITHKMAEDNLLRLAGYLVKFKGVLPNDITLDVLCQVKSLEYFCSWFINRQGKCTATVTRQCAISQSLARYLALRAKTKKDQKYYEDRVAKIVSFISQLPPQQLTYVKADRWLSLKTLDAIGWAYDPYNPEQYQHMSPRYSATVLREIRFLEEGHSRFKVFNFKRYARQATLSLMLRLLVRIPFRQRNLREMSWNPKRMERGRNLYLKDGIWRIRFIGKELKVEQKKGKINMVDYAFPDDLCDVLNRYLNMWRPCLVNEEKNFHWSDESNEQQFVFLNTKGKPYRNKSLTEDIKRLTYRYAEVAVNPHMLRSIWATEYIQEMKDPIVAAYMLNDKVETVMENYAELLNPSSADIAAEWLEGKLAK
jgi:hypothetical protein